VISGAAAAAAIDADGGILQKRCANSVDSQSALLMFLQIFSVISIRPIISTSTGQIFTKFAEMVAV